MVVVVVVLFFVLFSSRLITPPSEVVSVADTAFDAAAFDAVATTAIEEAESVPVAGVEAEVAAVAFLPLPACCGGSSDRDFVLFFFVAASLLLRVLFSSIPVPDSDAL